MTLDEIFPQLSGTGYRVTSPRARAYNCVAWALGRSDQWWQGGVPGYLWPSDIPTDGSVESYARLFERFGYTACPDSDAEDGYEKIAIFGIEREFTHVARQLTNGKWTSKLGSLEDIEHEIVEALTGNEYGSVVMFLKRPVLT
jgi:hypothetical protein